MSFGAVQSAITSMKNNRKLLSKRERLKNTLSSSEVKKTEYNLPKASPKTLKRIQEKMVSENKERKQKRLILIGFITVFLISILTYILL